MNDGNSAVEVWRSIPDLEGSYEASDLGRVRSVPRTIQWRDGRVRRCPGVILKPHVRSSDGRRQVNVGPAGARRAALVAHLVLSAFVGRRPTGTMACHNNGDTSDDRVSNLRWDSQRENLFDVQRHGHSWARNKSRCPRGHLLADPNLVPSKRVVGHRVCLACQRGNSKVKYWKERGVNLSLQTEADRYYEDIVSAVAIP